MTLNDLIHFYRICRAVIAIYDAIDANDKIYLPNDLLLQSFNIYAPFVRRIIVKPKSPWLTDNVKFMMNLRNVTKREKLGALGLLQIAKERREQNCKFSYFFLVLLINLGSSINSNLLAQITEILKILIYLLIYFYQMTFINFCWI